MHYDSIEFISNKDSNQLIVNSTNKNHRNVLVFPLR